MSACCLPCQLAAYHGRFLLEQVRVLLINRVEQLIAQIEESVADETVERAPLGLVPICEGWRACIVQRLTGLNQISNERESRQRQPVS